MIQTYHIQGMTCMGCVKKVKTALETLEAVDQAQIQLDAHQAQLHLNTPAPLDQLQAAIGSYTIQVAPQSSISTATTETVLPAPSVSTYKPLILIIGFILGTTLLAQYPFTDFSGMLWMRHFMAGFFIVFAFFKMLNLEGFTQSYQQYDIIAARWKSWGYIYPFIELGLGVLYLINAFPLATNWITIGVLGVSSIGVIKSNWEKRSIKCACLGDVFQLPMSTVTIVEDVGMLAMALWMLLWI